MQGRYRRLLSAVSFLILFISSSVFAGRSPHISTVDTVTAKVNTGQSVDSMRSFVRSMSPLQLQTLIDYLFEMDSIPTDLIGEVNFSVKMQRSARLNAIENTSDWDEKNIFCMKELGRKLDTTCVLGLIEETQSFTMPVIGVITSNFGWRKNVAHNGIDIDLRRGCKVVAAFDGVVRFARWQGGYGNVVVVRHANGLETLYAHLSKIKVKVGQAVNSGDVVGLGGATGNATGPHLHFEVRLKSKPINPRYLIEFESEKLVSEKLVFKSTRSGWAAYPPDMKEYVAQKGETVLDVAKHFGLPVKLLAEHNCINQWSRLKPGQRILIG